MVRFYRMAMTLQDFDGRMVRRPEFASLMDGLPHTWSAIEDGSGSCIVRVDGDTALHALLSVRGGVETIANVRDAAHLKRIGDSLNARAADAYKSGPDFNDREIIIGGEQISAGRVR